MSEDHHPLWLKIDEHGKQISELYQRVTANESRVHSIESRIDMMITNQAEGRSEVRTMLNDLHNDIQRLSADYHVQAGRKQGYREAEHEFSGWKRWLFPTIISGVMMLIALGIIQGGAT